MAGPALHRFAHGDRRYALDPETCFCFECDAISWDVIAHYPHETANRIIHLLGDRYDKKELLEVVNELEWLRATKAILKSPVKEELLKQFDVERGLKRMTVAIKPGAGATALVQDAAAMLLARSSHRANLELTIEVRPGEFDARTLAGFARDALRAAALAHKALAVFVRIGPGACAKGGKALAAHRFSAQIEVTRDDTAERALDAFLRAGLDRIDRLPKAFEAAGGAAKGRIVLHPATASFKDAVQELDEAGFDVIEIDIDGAFLEQPETPSEALFNGVHETAVYYANRLLQGRYFRLDPIAGLFRRIYLGEPVRRADPAGTNELAIDADGGIYPSRLWLRNFQFRMGSVADATIDEARLQSFEDIGSATTPACLDCWARCLCGGGTVAVHHALTGNYRTPHEPWCDAQRLWIEAAVAAFNLLSARGVNFTRIYQSLGRTAKPSLFQMVRAAFKLSIGLRPIEEADAEWLTKWENWNEAAYFLAIESGMFMATRYDREMDSLYPREYEQEFVLLRKSGEAIGLLRLRPDRIPGAARAWVYLRREADYADSGVRRGFRALLDEAGGQREIRRVTVPVGPREDALAAFLESAGFTLEGIEREALYLHGAYHDLRVYGITL